jgi:5-methylcytosine-specific restriction endonuclease McrA
MVEVGCALRQRAVRRCSYLSDLWAHDERNVLLVVRVFYNRTRSSRKIMDQKPKRPVRTTGAWPCRACRPRRIPRDEAQSGAATVRGRCSVCGRSVERHGVVLIAVRYVSREREGSNNSEDLRVICAECSAGREDGLKLPEPAWIGAVMAHRSVHMRLGETLKEFQGQPVAAATLKFVANQDAWQARVRELRYLGWNIATFNRRLPSGRVSSFYRLNKSTPWPPDPTGTIRQYERERARRNKSRK